MVPQLQFSNCLSETIRWCVTRADVNNPKYCLRSEDLRPPTKFDPEQRKDHCDINVWVEGRLVEHVVKERSWILGRHDAQPEILAPGRGRLLAHFFDYTNNDFLTSDMTNAFLDCYDTPPWDTWVYLVDQEVPLLVSWVPPQFISSVDEAIGIQIAEALSWVDEERPYSLYDEIPEWLVNFEKRRTGGKPESG